MLNRLRIFFSDPAVKDDPEKIQDAKTTHRVSIVLLGLAAFSTPFIFLLPSPIKEFALFGTIVGLFIWLFTIWLVKRERLTAAKIIILSVNTFNLSSVIYATGGLATSTIFTTLFLLAMANLLFPRRGAVYYGLTLFLLGSILYGLGLANLLPEPSLARDISQSTLFIFVFTLLAVASILWLASANYQRNLDAIRRNESELRESNLELDELKNTLQHRVEERTSQLEKRAGQFETISSVARSIASLQNMSEMLPAIARLINNSFGYYHVGIFLVDNKNEFAVLRATNSEGGQKMLDRQHKLKLDANSIVGFATSRGEPRIALDVGLDAVFFNNPDLPDTHSEMALPLRIGENVIGALDVQSIQPNAFSDEDIATLSTLADQVAIAIENTRLFSEAREALKESEETFARYVKQTWGSFAREARQTAFMYDGKRVMPIDGNEHSEQRKNVLQTGRLSLEKVSSTITVPIKLRGQTIGMLDVRSKKGQREWTQDELSLLEAAAERAALAIENARLVESAQRHAARERAIGDISTKIGAFSDVTAILQTAVEELGRKIGGATEVAIELGEDPNQGKS